MATPFLDNFNGAGSSTNLSSWTPSGGTAWTVVNGLASAATVETDGTLKSVNSIGSHSCDDQGSANHYTQARFKTLSAQSGSFICCRLVDSSNFVGFRFNGTGSTGAHLVENVAGTITTLVTFQGVDESVYRVEVNGTTAKIFENGVQKGTDQTVASSTETSQGIRTGTSVTSWIDDFEAGALAGGSPYSLTAGTGAFTLTGNAVTLSASRKLAAGSGTFTYTGNAATLVVGRSLAAATGAFTLTGNAATLTYASSGAYDLAAGTGVFGLTGNPVEFTYTQVFAWNVVSPASGSWSDAAGASGSWSSAASASGSWSDESSASGTWTGASSTSATWTIQ